MTFVRAAAPSAELVARVRELYQTRVSDVRFLIPVLNGLTKKEVIAALPKLIKLNPFVVKEVNNSLTNILFVVSSVLINKTHFINLYFLGIQQIAWDTQQRQRCASYISYYTCGIVNSST